MTIQTLTVGERLVRCTLGESVDRVPFGCGLGWKPWGETMTRWRKESGNDKLKLSQEFGFDPDFALPKLQSGAFPRFEELVIEKNDEFVIGRDWRGITMRNRRDGSSMPEFLDYPVKNPDDWQRYKTERLAINAERVVENWDEFKSRVGQTGEAVQVGLFPWGIFGTARDLLGAEGLLYAFCDYPEMVHDIMNHLTDLWLSLWEKVAAEVQIDHIHIWEDMSGKQGSLISMNMVEEFMMPTYDRIAEFGRKHGARLISVDTDGDCAQLVPIMMEHGINTMFPFEVQAGCDIFEFRRKHPALGIWGGLDKRALAGSRSDIDVEVNRAAKMVERGRYVPAFDHLIPPDVSWENYCYAVAELKKVCYGTFGR